MQNLPTPETYEKEFKYMPWGKLVDEVLEYVQESAPKNGNLLDLMCGPGYLLGKVKDVRSDLYLKGVDWDESFISYAKEKYSDTHFETADVLEWNADEKFDVVLCTAGLHHVEYDKQESLIKKIKSLLKEDGWAVVADPYIGGYANEQERKVESARLGFEYLREVIESGAPEDVVEAAVQILENDVTGVEFKTSVKKTLPLLKKHFSNVQMIKTWGVKSSELGDYYFILS